MTREESGDICTFGGESEQPRPHNPGGEARNCYDPKWDLVNIGPLGNPLFGKPIPVNEILTHEKPENKRCWRAFANEALTQQLLPQAINALREAGYDPVTTFSENAIVIWL